MSDVMVREARIDDVDVLVEIERDADRRYEQTRPELCGGDGIPRAVLERAIGQGRVRVVDVDGVVAGSVLLIRSEGELCVGQISVRRSFGQSGVGTRLLQHVIDTARDAGETSIVLNTEADIAWNAPWYARHGFRVVDRSEWTADMCTIAREQEADGLDWSTRVHMRLLLGR